MQTDNVVTGYGYIQGRFSEATTKVELRIGEFHFGAANGSYAVWIDGLRSPVIPYTPGTLFRIEKTPATVSFFADGQLIYSTSCDSSPRNLWIGAWNDLRVIDSVDYGVDTL